jgi:hypothetical protein
MADVLAADFEGATPFSPFTSTSGSVSQEGTIVHAGSGSMKSDATVAAAKASKTLTSATLYVLQSWFYIPSTLPIALSGAIVFLSAPGFNLFLHKRANFQEVGMVFSSGASDAYVSYAADTWIRLVARVDTTTGPNSPFDWNIGGVEQPQIVITGFGAQFDLFEVGWRSGGSAGLISYFDDVKVGNAAGDYESYVGAAASPLVMPHRIAHSRGTSW